MLASEIDNIWRHWWAGHMAAVGGQSLLPLDPIGGLLSEPAFSNGGIAGNRQERRTYARQVRRARKAGNGKAPAKHNGKAAPIERSGLPAVRPEPDVHDDTQFHDLGEILECLDDYFHWLRKMKPYSHSYDLYSRVGGIVAPSTGLVSFIRDPIAPIRPKDWPAFLMVSFAAKIDDFASKRAGEPMVCPKIINFTKVGGGDFAPQGTVFYEGMMYYIMKDEKGTLPIYFYIGIDENSQIYPLRMITRQTQVIARLRRRRYPGEVVTIDHKVMGYPRQMLELVEEYNQRHPEKPTTIEETVSRTFFHTLSATLRAQGGAIVNIRQNNVVARFGVPLNRTSLFFRDREVTTPGGRRRMIFHQVREYTYLRNGREITVPSHYRGLSERRFDWYGYEVCITLPDYHHRPIEGWTFATLDENEARKVWPQRDIADGKYIGNRYQDLVWNSADR